MKSTFYVFTLDFVLNMHVRCNIVGVLTRRTIVCSCFLGPELEVNPLRFFVEIRSEGACPMQEVCFAFYEPHIFADVFKDQNWRSMLYSILVRRCMFHAMCVCFVVHIVQMFSRTRVEGDLLRCYIELRLQDACLMLGVCFVDMKIIFCRCFQAP